MKKPRYPELSIITLFAVFYLSSCAPVNKLKYVYDEGPGTVANSYPNDRSEKTIQPYDYLYVKIFSLD